MFYSHYYLTLNKLTESHTFNSEKVLEARNSHNTYVKATEDPSDWIFLPGCV